MSDRSEGQGAIIVVLIALVLLLFVAGGGGLFIFARHRAMSLSQMEMVRVEEMRARLEAERAMVAERQLQSAEQRAAEAKLSADQAVSQATTQATLPAAPPGQEEITAAITAVLDAQREAWNAGDLDTFMQSYWHSDDLTFSAGGKTNRGWSDTLKRYQERYPTKEKMGTLSFDQLQVTPLGDGASLVLGQWHLVRDEGPLNGNFSLVFRNIDGRWLIIHDHTSQLSE